MKALIVLLALSLNAQAQVPPTGIVQYQTPDQVVLPQMNSYPSTPAYPMPTYQTPEPVPTYSVPDYSNAYDSGY
jgi:hypothetical protein